MLFDNTMMTPVAESLDTVAENYTGELMEATDRVFAEIMCEHTTEVAQLEAALYVADAVIESQIFDGQLTEEEAMAVAEGSIKDFVAGIRSKLAKLWEKVKGWFISLKNNMKAYLANGTKFFKQYENEIRTKAKNNKLEVKSYDYQLDKATGMCDDLQSALLKNLTSLCGALGSCKDVDSWKNAIARNADIEVKEDNFEDVFWKNCKVGTSFADAKDKIYEAFHNGEAKKIPVSKLPIDDFIKYGKDAKLISDLDEQFKEVQAAYKRSLDDLKKAEGAMANEKYISDSKMTNEQMHENAGKYVRLVSSKVSTYTALYGNAGQLHISLVKEFIKAGTTVCKAIVTRKAVTESAETENVAGATAATESSLFNSILGSL